MSDEEPGPDDAPAFGTMGRGRPTIESALRLNRSYHLRLSQEQSSEIHRSARGSGMTVSEFIRGAAMDRVRSGSFSYKKAER